MRRTSGDPSLLGEPRSVEVGGGGSITSSAERARRWSSATAGSPTPTSGARSSTVSSDRFRCLALDLPLARTGPRWTPTADLGPHGVASLIADVLERLDLSEAIWSATTPAGPTRRWPWLVAATESARGSIGSSSPPARPPTTSGRRSRSPACRRNGDPEVLGQLLKALEDPEVRLVPGRLRPAGQAPAAGRGPDSYALPPAATKASCATPPRRWRSAATAPVREAGERLIASSEIPGPADLVAGGHGFPPIAHAERYAAALKHGRLVGLADSYSFTPEDRPGRSPPRSPSSPGL